MRATAWPPLKADWLAEIDMHALSVRFHTVRLCPGRVGVQCEFWEWSIIFGLSESRSSIWDVAGSSPGLTDNYVRAKTDSKMTHSEENAI